MSTYETTEVQDMVEKLKGMLQHIGDTFVNATQLAETVRNLQTQIASDSQRWSEEVAALRSEIQSVRDQNVYLDEVIVKTRQERDEAKAEASHLREENASITSHRDELARTVEASHQRIAELEEQLTVQREALMAQLSEARRAHDDAEYRAMHWEEKHDNARKQLDGIKAALGVTVSEAQAPAPTQVEPQQEPEAQRSASGW